MKKIIVIILLILLITVFLAGKWLIKGESVIVIHPVRGTAVQAVYATGTVEPTVMLPISPRSSARLVELKVDEGSMVSKGQILAQLEDDELQSSIKQLQAREDFARKEFERNSVLVKNNVIPKKIYDQSKADLEAAVAATQIVRAQADYLKLTSPDDGLIIKRDGEIGQTIAANTPVFWLSCCAPLRISSEVDEEDIAKVEVGQKVLIRSDAFSGQIFNGKVQAITPKGDPIARSYRVRIELIGDTPLKIGMTAETNIIISEKADALLIPSSAVNKDKVMLVTDGRIAEKQISLGVKGTKQTEVLDGLTVDDLVVIDQDQKLKIGSKVNAVVTTTPES
jgi:membrane fusion protein, multidrug efflux system